ncbi:hypothetical protein U14_05216 [Candidatus Moduliflexus flocculans]|uniref:Uncharacterized protein n=1 Tax=Candidatus Moduliflexus flocculans TaxID=1499966 RepID=A0A081BRA8_9BACT|nr:hypothetical protein U14_05216 [Candidatus Moduliflexus flocculans]
MLAILNQLSRFDTLNARLIPIFISNIMPLPESSQQEGDDKERIKKMSTSLTNFFSFVELLNNHSNAFLAIFLSFHINNNANLKSHLLFIDVFYDP